MTVRSDIYVVLAFALFLLLPGCGSDEKKLALDAVKADKLGKRLQEVELTESKKGVWDIKGTTKSGVECTGTVEKPSNAGDAWPVSLQCKKKKTDKRTEDPSKGLFAKCEGGDDTACKSLYELGKERDDEREYETALKYFELACGKQIDEACSMACKYHFGERMQAGDIKKNYEKAQESCQKACDANLDQGCTTLSIVLQHEGKTEEALKKLIKACEDASNGEACMGAGMIVRISSPERAADPDRAIQYHRKGCGHRWPDACLAWGHALKKRGKKGDDKDAMRAFNKGCVLGNKEACSIAN